jgi:tetratricopeptide (TPR) repeat protein
MALRLPSNLSNVGALSWVNCAPFPPRGFAAFEDHALGNGDMFGLYWPIGVEDREPLVVEIVHDEWAMVPAFSSLDAFLRLTQHLDEAEHADWPSLEDDQHSPHACFAASREAAARGNIDEACALLRRAIELLPEYTAALSFLSAQCVRLGEHEAACRFAVRAVRSPPSLGRGTDLKKTWGWLSRQSRGPEDLADDPIWMRRNALAAPPSGGTKQNDVYLALAEAAEGYSARGDARAALSLRQAYGEFIWGETVSFQERYGFTFESHREKQRSVEARLPGGLRQS